MSEFLDNVVNSKTPPEMVGGEGGKFQLGSKIIG